MNKSLMWLLLAAVLAVLPGASTFNWAWMVPGGKLQLDRQALSATKFCALTFDDGPDRMYTAEVGRILERSGVQGTFFVLGKNVAEHPEGITELVAQGHEIASHSWSHPDFTRSSSSAMDSQLADTNVELARLNVTPRWFRPPYGAYNKSTVSHAADYGMQTILWSVDPRDWSTPGVEVIVNRVLEGAHPGAVILLHSTNPQTVAALPWIIDGLREDGYQLVTVSEWARLVSGGKPLAAPSRLSPEPAAGGTMLQEAAPLQPNPGRHSSGAGTLKVISNFSGTRELGLVLNRGRAERTLYSYSYAATPRAPMVEPQAGATARLFAGITQGAICMPAPLSQSPATLTIESVPAMQQPTIKLALQELLESSSDWQFPGEINTTSLSESPSGPVVPEFYLIKSAGGGWSGSASINGLLSAGRFNGVIVASEFNLTGTLHGLVAPTALYSVGRLDPASVVNLSRQDTSAILHGFTEGVSNFFITVNPDDLAAYRNGEDISEIRFLPEFLLMRSVTAGLMAAADQAPGWLAKQPAGLDVARFVSGDRQVLSIRGSEKACSLQIDHPDASGLYCTRLRAGGIVESATLSGGQLVIGDELVILSNFPLPER